MFRTEIGKNANFINWATITLVNFETIIIYYDRKFNKTFLFFKLNRVQ